MWLPWELPSGLYRENTLPRQRVRVLSSLSRPTLLVFGPWNGKKITTKIPDFPQTCLITNSFVFQNDQASSICCPFPYKLSWFCLQRPQNPALLAIPRCKLLPLLLGSQSSQGSGYTSQHQEEESKTLATLFRLILVGETQRKFCCGRKHSRQTNKWGARQGKGVQTACFYKATTGTLLRMTLSRRASPGEGRSRQFAQLQHELLCNGEVRSLPRPQPSVKHLINPQTGRRKH